LKEILEFESELRSTTNRLDPYWELIRDQFPKSEHKAVVELGTAIVSLNKIRSRIYKLHPELKPADWMDENQGND